MTAAVKPIPFGDPGPRAVASANRGLGAVLLRVDRGRRRKTVMLDPIAARMLAAELRSAADDVERGQR